MLTSFLQGKAQYLDNSHVGDSALHIRLVLAVPQGSSQVQTNYIDADFGAILRAPEISMSGPMILTGNAKEVAIRRVRRSISLDGSLNIHPPIFQHFGSGGYPPDTELVWRYFTDGKVELMFGFKAEDKVLSISNRLQLMSVRRDGVDSEILVLTAGIEGGHNIGLDVSQVAEFFKFRRLHAASYGEVTEGTFWVGEATRPPQAMVVAVRVMQKDMIIPENIQRQVEILQKIPFDLIKQCQELKFLAEDSTNLYMVSANYKIGSLLNWIARRPLDEKSARDLLRSIFRIVKRLHDGNIVHQDITPENIVLTTNDNAVCYPLDIKEMLPVLIDFEHARHSSERFPLDVRHIPASRHQACKKAFLCPEWAPWTKCYTPTYDGRKVDCWQLGVLMFVLLTGCDPLLVSLPSHLSSQPVAVEEQVGHWFIAVSKSLSTLRIPHIVNNNCEFRPFAEHVSSEAREVVTSLLRIRPEERLDIEAVLSKEWFLRGRHEGRSS